MQGDDRGDGADAIGAGSLARFSDLHLAHRLDGRTFAPHRNPPSCDTAPD
jgi:hypothetical protein